MIPLDHVVGCPRVLFVIGAVGVAHAPQPDRDPDVDRADAERGEPRFVALRGTARARLDGQVFVLLVITVAAAEVAVGLGIVIALFRNRDSVDVDDVSLLKW